MGDGDKLLKSPKGKSVISKIGDALSPKKLKLKKNKNKPLEGFAAEDGEDIEEEVLKEAPTTPTPNTAKEETDDSDNKSDDVQFFYEQRGRSTSIDSGEFSLGSPFTAQFKEH